MSRHYEIKLLNLSVIIVLLLSDFPNWSLVSLVWYVRPHIHKTSFSVTFNQDLCLHTAGHCFDTYTVQSKRSHRHMIVLRLKKKTLLRKAFTNCNVLYVGRCNAAYIYHLNTTEFMTSELLATAPNNWPLTLPVWIKWFPTCLHPVFNCNPCGGKNHLHPIFFMSPLWPWWSNTAWILWTWNLCFHFEATD
jgi:hypothetical protein